MLFQREYEKNMCERLNRDTQFNESRLSLEERGFKFTLWKEVIPIQNANRYRIYFQLSQSN